ncbi:hypothetical protein LCGC14_3146460 [marine sediment metagenome]|uniref:Uncharacterized protein n=1 Tax=marine sediment metagenome TaxID=412755 RepID=A0A0F8Y255_9ZZZZ
MEIELRLNGSLNWYRTFGASICEGALRREVHLPKGKPKIYAVFTKKKVADAFHIKAPKKTMWGLESDLAGLRRSVELMLGARTELGTAYKKGYRYVRIEY